MANYDYLPSLLQMYQDRSDPAQQITTPQQAPYVVNPNNPEQFIADPNFKAGPMTWADIQQMYNPTGAFDANALSQLANNPTYTNMYGPVPVNGTDAEKSAYQTLLNAGGGMYSGTQSSGFDQFMGDYGFLLPMGAAAATAIGTGALGTGAADSASGFGFGTPESLVGAEFSGDLGMGIPELGMVADPTTAATAISGGIPADMLGGGAGALTLADVGGLPTLPPGSGTVAQQLAKALTGSNLGSAISGGIQGFLQGASPTTQGYVRKARPPLTQPAFLGDQGQQPLGSAEDTAFNQMVSDQGDDISTRARQMAAQLRGRPGIIGFRST